MVPLHIYTRCMYNQDLRTLFFCWTKRSVQIFVFVCTPKFINLEGRGYVNSPTKQGIRKVYAHFNTRD